MPLPGCCCLWSYSWRKPKRSHAGDKDKTDLPTAVSSQLHCREKSCKKLLKCNGCPSKVLLFPEEGWARSASSSYWTLTPSWWCRGRCKVVEITGTRRCSTTAKISFSNGETVYIVGSFKKSPAADSDFKLNLTSSISTADYNMGYCMTGTLERGCKTSNNFQTTHFAVIRRQDLNQS